MIQFDNAVKRFSKLILDDLFNNGIRCWVAGGAVRDYFMGLPLKTDYDLFFPDENNYKKAAEYFKKSGATVKWESDNGMKVVLNGKTFDLIKKFFPDPQATIEAFDFTVSMFAVDAFTGRVYYGESSFIDLAKRQLMINEITYPASTMSRAFRYYKKGFSMCLVEMKKLIEAIQDMPKEELKAEEPKDGESAVVLSGVGMFFSGID